MAVYLDENMLGRDDDVVAFPHLLLCVGFVLRTNADLWGVHLVSRATADAVVAVFWNWATNKGLTAAAITDMYGCCNIAIRYGAANVAAGMAAWTAELAAHAAAIGWHGPAHGFDTGILAPIDGTYVEYQRQAAGTQPCKIFYKRDEKTQKVATAAVNSAGGMADVVAWDPSALRFRAMTFPATGVTGVTSTFHSGRFHELDYGLRLATTQV